MENETKVIWSVSHGGEPDVEQARKLIDMGVGLGIDGIEIAYGIERCVTYVEMEGVRGGEEAEAILETRRAVQAIAEYAQQQGLSVGMWMHQISGPRDLLDAIPDLRAPDGFIDLESPLIPELVGAGVSEFFEAVPEVDEVVLTLTETQVCVMRRPFSSIPLAERAQRVIQAVVDAVRYYGKGLVVRPFSPLAEDYQAILAALEKVKYGSLSVMMKTEPYDWHPFLPNNPHMRKVASHELRAEADACGEYYGRTVFPACYPDYLIDRMRFAADRGATGFVLRADRSGRSVVETLNEINLIAATAWAKDQSVDIGHLWELWAQSRLCGPDADLEGVVEVLAQTFEVIKNALYIDGQQMSHEGFPSFEGAKHIQMFHLFEPCHNLRHMRDIWSTLSERPSVTHACMVSEKEEAIEMARSLGTWFESMADGLPEDKREAVRASLGRLTLVARACLALVRVVAAHLQEVWRLPDRAVGDFSHEAEGVLRLADEVAGAEGEDFFGGAPSRMRGFIEEIRRERKIELARRDELESRDGTIDYVLCGLASEGHKLAKRLHTGSTRVDGPLHYRATGVGDLAGLSYEIKTPEDMEFVLEIDLVGAAAPFEGVAWLGPSKFPLRCDAPEGAKQNVQFKLTAGAVDSPARVEIWSSGAEPCRVSEIRIREATGED